MPDLRTIIGETPADDGLTLHNVLQDYRNLVVPAQDGFLYADRMIADMADRFAAALVSDEAVEAAARSLAKFAWSQEEPDWIEVSRAALEAAAKTIKGEA